MVSIFFFNGVTVKTENSFAFLYKRFIPFDQNVVRPLVIVRGNAQIYTEWKFSYCSFRLVFDMHDNVYATIPGYNCSSVALV